MIETTEGQSRYEQYNYRLSDDTKHQLTALEADPLGEKLKAELTGFEARARSFLAADLKTLEYAATIVYFLRQDDDWDAAVEKAVTFKQDEAVKNALSLAKQAEL